MAELVKPWNDGGSLSATYNGSGDGEAIFTSDVNEGIDRVMDVAFKAGNVVERRIVTQEGLRQPFGLSGGGVFRIKNGGRYGVLKVGEPIEPPTPIETYTRLTYIECNGGQYINTGYVVQEDDVIEMSYITTAVTTYDKAMFGVAQSGIGIWATIYSNTAYVRFGSEASVSISNARQRFIVQLRKGNVAFDDLTSSPTFTEMPTIPLYVFASNNNNNSVNMYGYCQSTGFKISKASGEVVMNLEPCKRDSDGKIGMLDLVGGQFFASEGKKEFIGGNEISIANDYELIDYTTFNRDKLYDVGIIDNTCRLEVMFQRGEKSATPYLYGVVTSPHTASVTAYLSTSGAWRFGSRYKGISMDNTNINKVEVYYGYIVYNFTQATVTKSTFTTPATLVLGGYRSAAGTLYKQYEGRVYYFRVLKDNALVLDWQPCKRLSDGVEGFWDCVSQTFIEPMS